MNQADFLSMFDEQDDAKSESVAAAKTDPAPPPVEQKAESKPVVAPPTAAPPPITIPIQLPLATDRRFALVLAMCANPAYAALDAVAFVGRAEAILANLEAQ